MKNIVLNLPKGLSVSIISLIAILGLVTMCTPPIKPIGKINTMVGSVKVEREGKIIDLKQGDTLLEKDIIETDKDGSIIAEFNNKDAELELQPNTSMKLTEYNNNRRHLYLNRGNSWLRVNRLSHPSQSFEVQSPSVTAGVRGTKFYNFQIGNYFGICHCEGNVEISSLQPGYKKVHNQDYMTLSKDNKVVYIAPEEILAIMGKTTVEHNHSVFDSSVLGGKYTGCMTPLVVEKLTALADQKMKALP